MDNHGNAMAVLSCKEYIGVVRAILCVLAVLWMIPASPAIAEEKVSGVIQMAGAVHMVGVVQMVGAGFEIKGVIPEMRSMLVGLGHPIVYHAQVSPERSYTVVLGSFESEFGRPEFRVMDARVEGGAPQKIDVIASVGWKKPFVTAITGKDIDGNGWLDITVSPHAEAKHPE